MVACSFGAPVGSVGVCGASDTGLATLAGLVVALDPGLTTLRVRCRMFLAPFFWVWHHGPWWLGMVFCLQWPIHSLFGGAVFAHRPIQVHALWAVLPSLVLVSIQIGGWQSPGVADDSFRLIARLGLFFDQHLGGSRYCSWTPVGDVFAFGTKVAVPCWPASDSCSLQDRPLATAGPSFSDAHHTCRLAGRSCLGVRGD